MLKIRARAYPLRDGFADCLMGLAIREEVEDLPVKTSETDTSFLDDAPATTVPPGAVPMSTEQPMEIAVDLPPAKVLAEADAEGQRRGQFEVPIPVTIGPKLASSAQPGKEIRTLAVGTPARGTATNEYRRTSAAVPIIKVVKLPGRNTKPEWRATRERLIEAFRALTTAADCDRFRRRHARTISLLRSSARREFDVFDSVSAAFERSLYKAAKKPNVVSHPV